MTIYNTKYNYVLVTDNRTYILNKGGTQGLTVTSETNLFVVNKTHNLGMQPNINTDRLIYHKLKDSDKQDVVNRIFKKINDYRIELNRLEEELLIDNGFIPVQGKDLNEP